MLVRFPGGLDLTWPLGWKSMHRLILLHLNYPGRHAVKKSPDMCKERTDY